MATRLQLRAQRHVVFDDAVVHDRDPAGDVRMRIGLVRYAMRGPTRMRDTGAAGKRIGQVQRFHFAHLALGAHATQFTRVQHGKAGGVVTAVLERLEADDQQGCHIALGYRSNNSTHEIELHVGDDRVHVFAPGPC